MAQNIDVTPGVGKTVATEEISSAQYQKVKIIDGTAASVDPIKSDGAGAMLVAVNVALPAGTAAIGKLAANSGVDIGDVTINNASGGSAVNIQDGGNSITVDGTLAVNAGTDLNTSLLALEAGGNLAAIAASASVLDDWDETNRAAVNIIAGQVGVAGGAGNTSALTQRVVLATDVALPAGSNTIGALTANQSVNVAQINGVTPLMGAGNTGTGSPRVTIATDQANLTTGYNIIGFAAHDAAVAGNPVLTAGEARGTLGTAVASGDVVRISADRYGRLQIIKQKLTVASPTNGTPIATATDTSLVAAPSASSHLVIHRIYVSNGGSTSTWCYFRDAIGGTKLYGTYVGQGSTVSPRIDGVWHLTGGGTPSALYMTTSAAGSVEVTVEYEVQAD